MGAMRTTQPSIRARPIQLLRQAAISALLLACLSPLIASAQSKDLDPSSHESRARQAVLDKLSTYGDPRLPVADVEVRFKAIHVFSPQHKHLHRPIRNPLPPWPSEVDFDFPEVVVDFLLYRKGDIVALVRVSFRNDTASTNVPDAAFHEPFTQEEWDRVIEQLREFNTMAPDLTKGPERFYSYLPSDMLSSKFRDWMPDTEQERLKISNEELRRHVALTFDLFVHVTWSWFEGVNCGESCIAAISQEHPKTADDFRAATEQLSQAVARMRELLGDLGISSPKHQAAMAEHTAAFYRLTDKTLNDRRIAGLPPGTALRIPRLPPSTPLYIVNMAGWDIYFAEVNGQLKIVDADYP